MAQCIAVEYNKFCYDDLPGKPCVNGQQTLGENLADNSGVRAAYRTYKALVDLEGGEAPLPGSLGQYNHDQIYFLSYGHNWCSNPVVADLLNQLQSDTHSPDQFRVTGVLMNMPEFAKAWNCPAGSPMAPTNHCNVWD